MELFLIYIYSDYSLAENTLTSTRCKRKSVIYPAVIYAFALCLSFQPATFGSVRQLPT